MKTEPTVVAVLFEDRNIDEGRWEGAADSVLHDNVGLVEITLA